MPWKAVSPMSEKMRFITKAQDGDESFAALDPETLRECLNCAFARARTLLVIAHP